MRQRMHHQNAKRWSRIVALSDAAYSEVAMRFTSRVRHLLCFFALATAANLPAQVTVGVAFPSSGNAVPFGSSSFGNEYQQIYTATAFPGSFSIGSIDFFHTQFDVGSGIFATGTYNIFLGTTSRAITAIDPIFANNETTQLVPFATLMIARGTSAAAPTFTIVGIPFVYNPSLGNLLLDIQYSTTSGALFLDFDRDANGVMSRVFGSGGSGTVTTAWVSLRDSTGSSPLSRRRPC